jgi:hypothetical protein
LVIAERMDITGASLPRTANQKINRSAGLIKKKNMLEIEKR